MLRTQRSYRAAISSAEFDGTIGSAPDTQRKLMGMRRSESSSGAYV